MEERERIPDLPQTFDPEAITPDDSPLRLADILASPEFGDLITPKVAVGDPAIDFELPRLDRAGSTVRLSDFAGHQRVALIFGSYT